MESEKKVFMARYNSTCRSCWKKIIAGEDSIYRTSSPTKNYVRKNRYVHENCPDVKEHRHEGHWDYHNELVRHRDKTAPEMHQYTVAGSESPAEVPVEQITVKFDASEIEEKLDLLKDGIAALVHIAADHEKRLASKEAARSVVVTMPDKPPVDVGRQHMTFSDLVTYVGAGVNVMMVGPAGGFKTSAAESLAKAMNLECNICPLGPMTSKSDLVGYMNGLGEYVTTLMRKTFEFGGICLLDEIDASNPAGLTIANGMLANALAGFADGMVQRHPDCHFIAAGNTFGKGADAKYVGRAQLDAATLDRWVNLVWEYDWDLTRLYAGNDEWTNYVQSLSRAVDTSGVLEVIGPRKAIDGAKLLAVGVPREKVERNVIWNPIKEDDRVQILAAIV